MKKQLVIIGIAVLLICVGLSGCEELTGEIDIEENIKGEWIGTQGETVLKFIFYSDGKSYKHTFDIAYVMGDYYVVGDRLECYYEGGSHTNPFENYYRIEMPDKDTLILTTLGKGHLTHDGRLEYMRLD